MHAEQIVDFHFEKKNPKTRTFLLNFSLFWLVQIVRFAENKLAKNLIKSFYFYFK